MTIMKTEQLAAALLADRNREVQERTDITKCFICGYSMLDRGSRFCSDRCREWFDAGNNPVDNATSYDLAGWRVITGPPGIETGSDYYAGVLGRQPINTKPGRHGFYIRCVGCEKEFESLGLRACSIDCERHYGERQKNLAVMAEAGIEPAPKRTCQQCGKTIPKWQAGKKTPSNKRFCSPKCAAKARREA
jgi:predicted nucleic acid-binding Zn ribbon protein